MKRKISNWTVEAFVFSGRPNPECTLTEKQAHDWMNLWHVTPPSGKEVHRPSMLGYTGCRLQLNEHSYWLLFDGCVSFYDRESVMSKKDTGRQMEYFLLNTATGEVKNVLRSQGIL